MAVREMKNGSPITFMLGLYGNEILNENVTGFSGGHWSDRASRGHDIIKVFFTILPYSQAVIVFPNLFCRVNVTADKVAATGSLTLVLSLDSMECLRFVVYGSEVSCAGEYIILGNVGDSNCKLV